MVAEYGCGHLEVPCWQPVEPSPADVGRSVSSMLNISHSLIHCGGLRVLSVDCFRAGSVYCGSVEMSA